MTSFRACAVIPTYDNPRTVEAVIHEVREHFETVIVVDDGGHAPARAALDRLEQDPGVVVLRHPHNRGKGAAMKTGLAEAATRGFSHALQVDADGQHDLGDIPTFLAKAREQPKALVLGVPVFDGERPRLRGGFGHWLTNFWTRLEISSTAIEDPQCGYRVYPVGPACAAGAVGNRMDYDVEVAVRMVWQGSPVINIPTRVRYLEAEHGGVSHFHMGWDNLFISWMHTRLVTLAILRWLWRPMRGARP